MTIRDLTVKERILLHFFDFNRFAEEYEVPEEVTQAGIAKAVGIRVHHVTQYVKPLVEAAMVEEHIRHVRGKPRRRKAYFLTPNGRHDAASLRASLFKESIPFRTQRGVIQELPLSRVYQEERRGTRLLELLNEFRSSGFIREIVEAPTEGVVDYTQEAPLVEQFYGREEELEEITKALEGTPMVVVTGMAGIGKTTLGSRICKEFRGRRSLFWRRIRPWDRALDLASRLAGFLQALGKSRLHTYLTAARPKELSQMEEILAADLAGVNGLLVFDDVHTAREDALDFLSLLYGVLKHLDGCSALLLSRSGPKFYSRSDVEIEASAVEVSLTGLDVGGASRFLPDADAPEELLENLLHLSGGNPLFLKILTKAGTLEGVSNASKSLEAYIAEEIEPSFSEEERDCLRIASLYEVPVSANGLLLEERGGMGTVLSLQRKGFLDQLETGGLWLHDFLRDYIQQGIPSERKRSLTKKVVRWLQEEAERAWEGGMPRDGIPYLENGLMLEVEPSRRESILERMGTLRARAADYPGAVEAYRAALELVQGPSAQADLHIRIVGSLGMFDLTAAQVEVKKGLRLLPSKPSSEAAWLIFKRGWLASKAGDFTQSLEDFERVRSWIPDLPADPGLQGLVESYAGSFHLFDPDRWDPALAKAHLEKALEVWEEAGDRIRLRDGEPFVEAQADTHFALALAELQTGRVEEALALLAIALSEAPGIFLTQVVARRVEAWVRSECLGDHAGAEEIYRDVQQLGKNLPLKVLGTWPLPRSLVDLFRRQGRNVEAKESLEYLLADWGEDLDEESRIENLSLLVRLCVLCEESEAASSNLEEAESVGTATDSDFARFCIHWARGAVHASQGQLQEAGESFKQAFALRSERPRIPAGTPKHLATSGHRWEFLLDYGRFLAAAGDKKRANELLLRAHEELRKLSRRPLEQEARKALRSLGVA